MDKLAFFNQYHFWGVIVLFALFIFRHKIQSALSFAEKKRHKLYQSREPIFFKTHKKFFDFKIKLFRTLDGDHFNGKKKANILYAKVGIEKLRIEHALLDQFLCDYRMYFPKDILILLKEILEISRFFIDTYESYLDRGGVLKGNLEGIVARNNDALNILLAEIEDILRHLLESNDNAKPIEQRWGERFKAFWKQQFSKEEK